MATIVERVSEGQRRTKSSGTRKLDGNIARDVANQAKLRDLGWTVFVVWECQLKTDIEALLAHLHHLREATPQSP